jgi:PhoPQ-activated pathogenicity-related protein
MRNGAKNSLDSGVLALSMLSAIPAIGEVTALDRYVAAPDASCRYQLIATIPGNGYAAHVLEMSSQRWRDEAEVDRPLWKHWLTIIEPEQVTTGTGLLIVGGGSNESKPPARVNPLLAMGAVWSTSPSSPRIGLTLILTQIGSPDFRTKRSSS